MQLAHPLVFLKGYLRNPRVVGSIAPSSRALAAAICKPYQQFDQPASVLEVGAGTGPITRYIGTLLGPNDLFDICELNQEFADILERDVLSRTDFTSAVAEGRVRLLRKPVQELDFENRYDFVISGLPFTRFSLRDIHRVLGVIRRCLKPSGVFSYYEYVGMRRVTRYLSFGRSRRQFWRVSAYLSRSIRRHQFKQKTVLMNLPPARTRHLRFDIAAPNAAIS
jgi:phospholipid N-methyltransferase